MEPMEKEIRELLAAALVGPEVKAAVGYPCTGLARKMQTGFDQNPRTLAAILVIKKLLQAQAPPAAG